MVSFDQDKAGKSSRTKPLSWMMDSVHHFQMAHERLKHRVHTAWRFPLPPWGRAVMGFVYFSIPVIAGYNVSVWAISKSDATLDERLGGT